MGFETPIVERKILGILDTLGNSDQAVGSLVIARRLIDQGVKLSPRMVRHHLKLMDDRGLTRLAGLREGRVITKLGQAELQKARVSSKTGVILSKIEMLAFRTDIDLNTRTGSVPVNITFFRKEDFKQAIKIMKPVFKAGLCASELVAVAEEGDSIGGISIPEGKVALATVCSIAVHGALLKAGIPMDSKFAGILQIGNHKPLRFVDLINYAGCSLDPAEIFIRAKMTSVNRVVAEGDGEILANFREVSAVCLPIVEEISEKLRETDIRGILLMGKVSEPVCEIPIELNRIGIILVGGLNPVAAAAEAGIAGESMAMSTMVDYQKLTRVYNIN